MKIKFEKVGEKLANKIFLKLEYMSGDADAYEYEEVEIEGISFKDWKEKEKEIEEFIKPYKLISEITDCNSSKFLEEYDEVKEKYGEEIANIFDEVPGDSTTDNQNKAQLSSMELVAYDDKSTKYSSYL